MKYCMDCKYFKDNRKMLVVGRVSVCLRTVRDQTTEDPVWGKKVIQTSVSCSEAREPKKDCGPEGKYWEEKKQVKPQKQKRIHPIRRLMRSL
jgi:hypothetical protein